VPCAAHHQRRLSRSVAVIESRVRGDQQCRDPHCARLCGGYNRRIRRRRVFVWVCMPRQQRTCDIDIPGARDKGQCGITL